jgi:PAS domain-containing protein
MSGIPANSHNPRRWARALNFVRPEIDPESQPELVVDAAGIITHVRWAFTSRYGHMAGDLVGHHLLILQNHEPGLMTCSIDTNGKFIDCNRAFAHFWDYKRSELVNTMSSILMRHDGVQEPSPEEASRVLNTLRDQHITTPANYRAYGWTRKGVRREYDGEASYIPLFERWDCLIRAAVTRLADALPDISWIYDNTRQRSRARAEFIPDGDGFRVRFISPQFMNPVERSGAAHDFTQARLGEVLRRIDELEQRADQNIAASAEKTGIRRGPRHHRDRADFLDQLGTALRKHENDWAFKISVICGELKPKISSHTLHDTLEFHGLLMAGGSVRKALEQIADDLPPQIMPTAAVATFMSGCALHHLALTHLQRFLG